MKNWKIIMQFYQKVNKYLFKLIIIIFLFTKY